MSDSRRPAHRPASAPEWIRIGNCVVNIPLREIQTPGRESGIRVTPKAIGVLLALTEANGRPVSRSALLERVWPGTLPTGDVVTQAIVQLRRAFADGSGSEAAYISTINRSGYRLVVPAEALDATPCPAPFARSEHSVQPQATPLAAVTGNRRAKSRGSLGILRALLLAVIAFATSGSVH